MSLCVKGCGMCCWNWLLGPGIGRCEYLSDDNACSIYDRWEEFGLGQCRTLLTPNEASSLPDECAYVVSWKVAGAIDSDHRKV